MHLHALKPPVRGITIMGGEVSLQPKLINARDIVSTIVVAFFHGDLSSPFFCSLARTVVGVKSMHSCY